MNISDLLKHWRVEKGSSQLAKMPASFYKEARELIEGDNPYEAKKAQDLFKDIVHMRQHKMLMACLRQIQGGAKPENLLGTEKAAYENIYRELDSMNLKSAETQENEPEPEETVVETESTEDEETVEEPGQETLPEAEEKAEAEEEVKAPEPEVEKESSEEAPKEKKEETPEKKEEKPEEEAPKEVFKGKTENKAVKRVRFLKPMPAFVGPDLKSLGPFDEDQETELDEEIAEILLKNDAIELI